MGLSQQQDLKGVMLELKCKPEGMTFSEIMNSLVFRANGWNPQTKPHLFSKNGNFRTSSMTADFKGFDRLKSYFMEKIEGTKRYRLTERFQNMTADEIVAIKFWSKKWGTV